MDLRSSRLDNAVSENLLGGTVQKKLQDYLIALEVKERKKERKKERIINYKRSPLMI